MSLSTEGLRHPTVINLGASKFAPRFIEQFTVLNAIGDAYTLDIPSSPWLHPKFYVGRIKEYRPATLHVLVPTPESKAHRLTFPPALLDAPMTLDADALSSARIQEPGVSGSSSARSVRVLTTGSHSRSSRPASTIRSSFSIQLSMGSLVHSRIDLVLDNQDARVTIARSRHRLWMRKVK